MKQRIHFLYDPYYGKISTDDWSVDAKPKTNTVQP